MNNLTERERIVLEFIAQGYTNREIAEKISVSTHTVKAHVNSILRKFEVKNRVCAVVKFIEANYKNEVE